MEPAKEKQDRIFDDANRQQIMEQVVKLYQVQKEIDYRVSLRGIADECGITPLKVRKLLITAGVYENDISREIATLWKEGKTTWEIQEQTGLSAASVHSYLPYSRTIYGKRISVPQEWEQALQNRQQIDSLLIQEVNSLKENTDWKKVPSSLDQLLWDAILLFQSHSFTTAKNLKFTYSIKGNEMFVSRKDKSITKATILLAFHKAMELQRGGNGIAGPKKLGTFGASYLFPIFLQLGVISIEKNSC